MKTLSSSLLVTAICLAVVAIAVEMRVHTNKNAWVRDGFYGFPVVVATVDIHGKPQKVALTEARREPLPSEYEQWCFAAKELWELCGR